MQGDDRPTIGWATLALVVPPTFVFILSDLLIGLYGWNGVVRMPALAPLPNGHYDAAGRLYILAALLVLICVTFLTLLLFVRHLVEEFDARMRGVLLATLATGIGIGTIWLWISMRWSSLETPLGKNVIDDAVTIFGNTTIDVEQPGLTVENFEMVLSLGRIVPMLGAAAVIVGAVACLARPAKSVSLEDAWAHLNRQRARLSLYVNAAAIFMITAIAFQLAWTRWPLMLLREPAAAAFSAHIDAFALYSGVSLSLVIAVFALPVLAGLRATAAELASKDVNAADRASAMAGPDVLQSLSKILVILAPALAGVIPTLADVLKIGG